MNTGAKMYNFKRIVKKLAIKTRKQDAGWEVVDKPQPQRSEWEFVVYSDPLRDWCLVREDYTLKDLRVPEPVRIRGPARLPKKSRMKSSPVVCLVCAGREDGKVGEKVVCWCGCEGEEKEGEEKDVDSSSVGSTTIADTNAEARSDVSSTEDEHIEVGAIPEEDPVLVNSSALDDIPLDFGSGVGLNTYASLTRMLDQIQNDLTKNKERHQQWRSAL